MVDREGRKTCTERRRHVHPEVERLFTIDESLRNEAGEMLAQSGIGAMLQEAGYRAVGSYPMRTMTWRDLDFERSEDPLDWDRYWSLGSRLARSGWCWKLSATTEWRPGLGVPALYWGLRVTDVSSGEAPDPGDPTIWKIDLWSLPPGQFEQVARRREEWMRLLDDEKRSYVLAIKEAVCTEPEYRKSLLSVHVYEAVLEHGVRDLESFRAWWQTRVGVSKEEPS
jgi:hypothetical protein